MRGLDCLGRSLPIENRVDEKKTSYEPPPYTKPVDAA